MIRKKVKDLIRNSSFHGLSNAFRTENKFLKYMWLILFLISSCAVFIIIIDNINKYFDYEVVTKIDKVEESKADFPALTFYNINDPAGNFSLQDIMIDCFFNNLVCNESDFDTLTDKQGYRSYRLKLKETAFPGKIFGLDVILHVKKRPNVFPRRTNGFEMVIHNRSINPNYYWGFSNDAINISPGLATILMVSRVFYYKLGKPYNKCIKENTFDDSLETDFLEFMIKKNRIYSYQQKHCINYCISSLLASYYNLSIKFEDFSEAIEDLRSKLNITNEKIFSIYLEFLHTKKLELCIPKCQMECDSLEYDIITSVSKFPNEEYGLKLLKNPKIKSYYPENYTITLNDLEKNLIYFRVFYKDLRYTVITQMPKTNFFELVSNLGGILGLFIGMSFLSFAELFEILIECLLIFITGKSSQQIVHA